jgi:hypothetical protein
MNVKLIKMWSGEDVIADLIEEGVETITIQNPIVAIPTGQGQLGFAPWSPLLEGKDKPLAITRKYVVYITNPNDEIIDNFNKMFSPLVTPSSSNKKIIT